MNIIKISLERIGGRLGRAEDLHRHQHVGQHDRDVHAARVGQYRHAVRHRHVEFGRAEVNDGTVNVYWDGTSGQYELNNEEGASKDFEVHYLPVLA